MKYRLVALLFFLTIKVLSQKGTDSLLVKYNSNFERQIFLDSKEGNKTNSFITSLFAIDSLYTIGRAEENIDEINSFFKTIANKTNSLQGKKKTKYIFKHIHDRFFKKYDIEAYFPEIFKTGIYNCVTATAFYAYAFDYFDVPYQIKETPTHVFLVAYPEKHNIYIETTDPGKLGSFAPSESIIKNAVDDIISHKLITREYVNEVGYNKAFNTYYYGDENISKTNLLGIQYYNKTIGNINKEKYKNAYYDLVKSAILYNNKKVGLLNDFLIRVILEKTDFQKIKNFKWFLTAIENIEDKDFLKYKFNSVIFNSNFEEKELDIIEKGIFAIKKENLKTTFLEQLYSYRAEISAKKQRQKLTLFYAEKIYSLNKDNLTAKNYIAKSKIFTLAQKNLTEDRLSDLQKILEIYPFVKDFGDYLSYKIYLHSYLSYNSFNRDNFENALTHLKKVENLIDSHSGDVGYNEQTVGNVFGAVGAYFYRKGDIDKAKKYLNMGLAHSPDNESINRKLKLIKSDD